MLVIFDLDDTLIDTSGSIIPPLLKQALWAMKKAGLVFSNFDQAYRQLLHLDRYHLNSSKALCEFLEIYHAPKKCFEIGIHKISIAPFFSFPIQPLEGAFELLSELSKSYQLALVTRGQEKIQRAKMYLANILPQFFSSLCFVQGEKVGKGKKNFYISLVKKFSLTPSQVIVCGDRIASDLTPAKELGCKTVQIKWGRGLGNTGLKRDVDYTILDLRQLKEILESLKS